MFKWIEIENFRALKELRIDRLSRINLIAGRNNSGKTTLLEALFLLAGGGNPQMALNVHITRGLAVQGTTETIVENFWKPIFSAFDVTKTVKIAGAHASYGTLTLEIELDRPTTIQLPLDDSNGDAMRVPSGEHALSFSFENGKDRTTKSLRSTRQELQIDQPHQAIPFSAVILSSRIGNFSEDAIRMGQLRKQKQEDSVLEALRVVEPRLTSITDSVASGTPMIWGDIGLSELVPLPVMGDGMARIARLVLAISSTPGGVVLVDEIENGLHHSILPEVWKVVHEVANRADTQIFATTHSFECIEAAQPFLRSGDFCLHRLEFNNSQNRCVTYEPEEIDVALRHNLEIR